MARYQRIVGADPAQARTVRILRRYGSSKRGTSRTTGTQRISLHNVAFPLASVVSFPTQGMHMLLRRSTGHTDGNRAASEACGGKRTNGD
jgi:hypothetical protein